MTTETTSPNPNFIDNDLTRVPDKSFRDYPLDDRLVDALEERGITHPFPIQELTLPVALKGQDIIGQARTGTGKTLGFGLPMIQRLDPDAEHTQCLIVTPTRELAIQVHDELSICQAMGFTSTTVYGGVGYEPQIEALDAGCDVVVGTPGRLLDMLGRGHLDLSKVGCVILDEADEMLDMGFLPDVERLLDAANEDNRHTMLFSATMPASVVKLARRYTDSPLFMGADSSDNETAPTVDQYFFQVFRMDKPRVLARILQQPNRGNAMVFTRTKAMADRLVRELGDLDVSAIAIHGDLRQAAREKNLDKFRSNEVDVLCATEVAARGMDIPQVTHVINYDMPDDETMYLHRIGRTARAGESGAAITFAEHSELARLQVIKRAVEQQDNETLEIFSTSDELGELFDLPEETPWDHMSRSSKSGGGSGGSGSGGRRSRSRSRGSLDNPRGEKHDADLDSDHDRDRDRDRDRGRSLDARIRDRTKDRDDDGGDQRRRSRSRSSDRSDSSSSRGGDSSGRDRSRRRSSGSSSGRSSSSRSSSGRSRSKSSDSSSRTSSSSGSGRVRARGGKPVGDDRGGSDSGDSNRRSRSRGRRNRSGGSTSKDDDGKGRSGGGRNRNSGNSKGGSNRNRSKGNNSGSGSSGGGNKRSGNKRGGGSNRGGNGRSGSADAGSVDLPRKVKPTRVGSDARGDGSPRLERRVAVEQLP